MAIDIPIGLPDTSGRAADAEARRELVGKSSSVFSTPTRAALEAETYAEGRAANLAATQGATSVSAQAYALREKVLQVDAWVRSGPRDPVIEVHPEISFARMAGAPVLASKKDADGVLARREALAAHGIAAPPWFRGRRLRRGRPARRVRGGVVGRTPLAWGLASRSRRPGGLLRRHPRRYPG